MAMTNERALKRALAAVRRCHAANSNSSHSVQNVVDYAFERAQDALRAEFAPNRRGAKKL